MFLDSKKYLAILIFLVLLSGCLSTPYTKHNFFTGGFIDTQLGENIFRIDFKGNKWTSREKAIDFTLLRAAELSLERNFRYFVIVETDKYDEMDLKTSPLIVGDYSYGTRTSVRSAPRTSHTIVAFRAKPTTNQIVYDAKFIVKSIKGKYEIKWPAYFKRKNEAMIMSNIRS